MTRSILHRSGIAAAAATALLVLAGCGGGSSSTASPPPTSPPASSPSGGNSPSSQPSAKDVITIKNFGYSGATTVKAGATVSVTNDDSVAHTVTADSGSAFDVTVDPGATKTFTAPSKPGAYPYHCTFHSNMHGSLTVS
jgi:plastocyanin